MVSAEIPSEIARTPNLLQFVWVTIHDRVGVKLYIMHYYMSHRK